MQSLTIHGLSIPRLELGTFRMRGRPASRPSRAMSRWDTGTQRLRT